jgi:hypothetical protein
MPLPTYTATQGASVAGMPPAAEATAYVPAAADAVQPSLVHDEHEFRANLAAFLHSVRGGRSKVANPVGAGPMGRSEFGGNGQVGGLQMQTQGPRKGALMQVVRLGGRTFHIYFHRDGQREVVKLPPAPPAYSAQ